MDNSLPGLEREVVLVLAEGSSEVARIRARQDCKLFQQDSAEHCISMAVFPSWDVDRMTTHLHSTPLRQPPVQRTTPSLVFVVDCLAYPRGPSNDLFAERHAVHHQAVRLGEVSRNAVCYLKRRACDSATIPAEHSTCDTSAPRTPSDDAQLNLCVIYRSETLGPCYRGTMKLPKASQRNSAKVLLTEKFCRTDDLDLSCDGLRRPICGKLPSLQKTMCSRLTLPLPPYTSSRRPSGRATPWEALQSSKKDTSRPSQETANDKASGAEAPASSSPPPSLENIRLRPRLEARALAEGRPATTSGERARATPRGRGHSGGQRGTKAPMVRLSPSASPRCPKTGLCPLQRDVRRQRLRDDTPSHRWQTISNRRRRHRMSYSTPARGGGLS